MHQGSNTDFVVPYFPRALAVSSERSLKFNFDLRLLDTLSLPCEIVSRDENTLLTSTPSDEPVKFNNAPDAIAYCHEKMRDGWPVNTQPEPSQQRRLRHPELQKEQLFAVEGKSLQHLLTSGVAELDANVKKVKLDRYAQKLSIS